MKRNMMMILMISELDMEGEQLLGSADGAGQGKMSVLSV